MLNQYVDEVISNGAEAVLPHSLEEKWLDMIYAASKRFIKAAAILAEGAEKEEYDFSDLYSNLMLTSVMEKRRRMARRGPQPQLADQIKSTFTTITSNRSKPDGS